MRPKHIVACVLALFLLVAGWTLCHGLIGYNASTHWQVHQSVWDGHLTVIKSGGPYWRGFGTVWTYPKTLQAEYTQTKDGEVGESMKVTFNDGGTAHVSAFVKIGIPDSDEKRLLIHEDFSGDQHSIVVSLKKHLNNCIRASGPVMSASENQASRKGEFNQIIEEQLERGLFKMRRLEIELNDLAEVEQIDGKTVQKKARVSATEVVMHDGRPIVIQPSPLLKYEFTILQFSIAEIEYDKMTREQFAAKKESYLKAEQAKAQRQEEVQQRLMVQEKGLRQNAEIEAEENLKKTRALIQATQEQEVAVINKTKAVTQAQQRSEVAEQLRKEAESLKQIAGVKVDTAELEKKAIIAAAQARKEEIDLGGGLTEKDRVLAQIAADRDVKVAEGLSKIAVPNVVICGGGSGGESNLTNTLMNMVLLEKTGVIKAKPAAK